MFGSGLSTLSSPSAGPLASSRSNTSLTARYTRMQVQIKQLASTRLAVRAAIFSSPVCSALYSSDYQPDHHTTVTRAGPARIHKSKANPNGTFSIGKTWNIEDLRGLEVLSVCLFLDPLQHQRHDRSYTIEFWLQHYVPTDVQMADRGSRGTDNFSERHCPAVSTGYWR